MVDAITFDQHEIRCPAFTLAEAEALARESYGIQSPSVKELGSFQDQNFRVTDAAGRRLVLKIANVHETFDTLDLQNQAMLHLAGKDGAFPTPRVIPAEGGEWITTADHDGQRHFVRLLTYLPGQTLVEFGRQPPSLLEDLGRVAGALSRHLADFTHPAGDRLLQWDLRHAGQVTRAFLKHVADQRRRDLIEQILAWFEAEAAPWLPGLRTSIIHGDLVDYNLLIQKDDVGRASLSGLIDFGDVVHSYTVGELAVLLATVMAHAPERPLAAAAQVARHYHQAFPLTEVELAVLFPLICLRVCATTTSAAQQATLDSGNRYVAEFAETEWRTLDLLAAIPPALAQATFRDAGGLEPHPRSAAIRRWLEANRAQIGPPVAVDLVPPAAWTLDLSIHSDDLAEGVWETPARLKELVARRLAERGPGLGRYAEARLMYTRPDDQAEPRAVHLGIDVFVPAKTAVFAPLAGVVELANADALILRHEPEAEIAFYTRWAHVKASAGLRPGVAVARGALIARVAPADEAAPLPPHLHLQLACDLPGQLPGLAAGSEREIWLSICPDPNLILGIPGLFPAHDVPDTETLVERRARSLARSQETYYERPMQIVRGWRQYLIDEAGRSYLDSINNVAHVGHGHPRVVEAVRRQMARLNTNSRFLYAGLVEYAERLASLLPDPLRVVFLVCSGSEANDLALRLARAYTGREDVLTIDGAYHGNTTAVYEVSTSLLDNPLAAKNTKPYVHAVAQPNTFRGPYSEDDLEAGRKYAADVASKIEQVRNLGRGPAAFIGECLLGAPGGMLPPAGYFPRVYQAVRAAGGVCIADEVQVGFGRMGTHFWAFEMQGVVPDIVTMGKPMGNGHPVSAVVTTPEIAEAFRRQTTYFNTYGGNPVSCAAGLAVLDVMRDEGLQANARDVGQYFKAQLNRLRDRHALVGAVYGWGLYLGVDLVRDRELKTPAAEEALLIAGRMRDYGVIVYPTGDYYNILKIKPPLVFTRDNADFFTQTLDRVLTEGW